MHIRLGSMLAAAGLILAATGGSAADYDVLLTGGTVIDGTGAPPMRADVAIRGERIAAIGTHLGNHTRQRIDVSGLIVAPGFIDVHSHADEDLGNPVYRAMPAMIHQGVTTAVVGVDGEYDLATFRHLQEDLTRQSAGVNFAAYIGHNGLRTAHMGTANRSTSATELAAMQADVLSAMKEGALGLSTGLMYLPGLYATTDEVIAVGRPGAAFGGLYDSHDRDPAFHLLDSVTEVLDIARGAGLEAHVAHLKAVGLHNAGKTSDLIAMIKAARARGEVVTADAYPYDGASARLLVEVPIAESDSTLARAIQQLGDPATPREAREGLLEEIVSGWRAVLTDPATRARTRALTEDPPPGEFSWVRTVGWDSFRIVAAPDRRLEGQMLVDIARARSISPFDALATLILQYGGSVKLTLGSIREEEVRELLRQPWVMISSDGKESGIEGGRGHPRYRGSFARVLGHYVRDVHLFTLQEAVHRMTGLPAAYLKLRDRGTIRVGAIADVVVFDPVRIRDRSSWVDPAPYAEGVRYTYVNGMAALVRGEPTGTLAGRFLPFRSATSPTTTQMSVQ